MKIPSKQYELFSIFLILLLNFSYTSAAVPPAINSFTPDSGSVGTLVTITGTNLDSITAFSIGGATAIIISDSGNSVIAMVMPGAVTGVVSITTAGGTVTSLNNFNITATPYPSIQQGGKLSGSDANGQAEQGFSVCISADGNTAIVGGFYDNSNVGAAWIYTRTKGVWTQQGSKLVGTGASGNAQQGISVALSADGNTAIVGGFSDSSGIGAAWIFTRNQKNNTWSQQGSKLTGSDAAGYSQQGSSVSLSADGNTALVGGYTDSSGIGAAWIYIRNGNSWSQQGNKLTGSDAIGEAGEGRSVALSSDGNTALVGGNEDNGGIGAAWVYTRNGNTWTQQGNKLLGSDAIGGSGQGISVSLSADGNTAMVGGDMDNSDTGAVWVYTRSQGIWTQQGSKLVGTGATGEAWQGRSVSLSADGNTAIEGGSSDNSEYGAAWIFTRSVSKWVQRGKKLIGTGSIGNAYQSISVYLSANGYTAVEGGYFDDSKVGAAWIFVSNILPTIQASNINFSNIKSNQMHLSWTNGNGDNRVVFVKQGTGTISYPVNDSTYIADNNLLNKGTQLGNSEYYCVYNGNGDSVTITGLNTSTLYSVEVFEYNGNSGNELYLTSVATNNPSIDSTIAMPMPTIQASNINFSNVYSTQMIISWTNGNGSSRALFVKQGTGAITNPLDSSNYVASSSWMSKGTQLGNSGYYCVYNGTGNTVTLTGLTTLTEYTAQVFEYNGNAGEELYLTSSATNNPNTQDTHAMVNTITANKPNVYPNPTTGLVTLDASEGIVTIMDSEGRKISETNIGDDKTVNFYNYNPGIYFLILKTNDSIYFYKIIKQ